MNICIIPARGGSKRIPRKNIRLFNGLPMIAWSIKAAQHSNCFDRIIVSTDDAEISDPHFTLYRTENSPYDIQNKKDYIEKGKNK